MRILDIAQVILSVLLVGAILLQNRGAGLGAAFGGDGGIYRTKRGLEKSLFIATIILAAAFLVTAVANILF